MHTKKTRMQQNALHPGGSCNRVLELSRPGVRRTEPANVAQQGALTQGTKAVLGRPLCGATVWSTLVFLILPGDGRNVLIESAGMPIRPYLMVCEGNIRSLEAAECYQHR